MSDIVWLLKFTSPDDYKFCYDVMCQAAEEIEKLRQETGNLSKLVDDLLYDKQQVPAYSDNDFVKWQEYRQEMERKLAAMTYNYHHAREEAAYWQREAMKQQGRD